MTSSSDGSVLRGGDASGATAMRLDTDLSTGRWTRLGGAAVRGDGGTDAHLDSLADQVRAAARAEGYTAGWSEGHRTGLTKVMAAREEDEAELAARIAEHAAQAKTAMEALTVAVDRIQRQAAADREQLESRLSTVVVELVEAVLGAELRDGRAAATSALARALAAAPSDVDLTIRLNPADHATLVELGLDATPNRVTLVTDPAIGSGDAEVTGETTYVDASIATALERVREVLAS
jgi:flagellar assembly protein FliH